MLHEILHEILHENSYTMRLRLYTNKAYGRRIKYNQFLSDRFCRSIQV